MKMSGGLLSQWLWCSRDDAVSETVPRQHALLQSGGRSRGTWAPLPSPANRSERYAVTQMDQPALAREELQMLRREYEETRDQLEKESRLAQSRAKVALRIHAREQGLQRRVHAALARAKRAEESARKIRLENAVLRQHCISTIQGCTEQGLHALVAGKVKEREAARALSQETPADRRARWIRLNRSHSQVESEDAELDMEEKTMQAENDPLKVSFVVKTSTLKKTKRAALEDISNNASSKHRTGSEEITLVF